MLEIYALRENCPNTEFFLSVFFCIQSEYRKIWTRKAPYLDTFHALMFFCNLHQTKTCLSLIKILTNIWDIFKVSKNKKNPQKTEKPQKNSSWRRLCLNRYLWRNLGIYSIRGLLHCEKSVRIWSFSGLYFPAFGLKYSVEVYSIRSIQSECGKIRTRKTPNTDTFHAKKVN